MVIYQKVDKVSDQIKNRKMLSHFYYHFGAGVFSCLNCSMAAGTYNLEQFQFLTDLLGESLVCTEDALTSLINSKTA